MHAEVGTARTGGAGCWTTAWNRIAQLGPCSVGCAWRASAYGTLMLPITYEDSANSLCAQMPDLVSRLAALHGTLTIRAGMQDRLLALSGRLELALAQAELRTPAAAKAKGGKGKDVDPNKAGTRYVEGESDDERMVEDEDDEDGDEDGDSIVDDMADSDAGSEEIVELGDDEMVSGSEDDEGDEDEDEDDDEDADEDELPRTKRKGAFVDDEAEEWDDEESSDEE